MQSLNIELQEATNNWLWGLAGIVLGAVLTYILESHRESINNKRKLGFDLTLKLACKKEFDKNVHAIMFAYPISHKVYEMYCHYCSNVKNNDETWGDNYRHKIVIAIANSCGRSAPGHEDNLKSHKNLWSHLSHLSRPFKPSASQQE